MKRFAEQFNKKASNVRLSAAERRDLRERLVSYMEYHPLPPNLRHDNVSSQSVSGIASEPFWAFNFDLTVVRSFAGAFAIILVITVPMLAERSMPGDILYPVKVEFNEELRSTLAISPYAQVEWETERLERRLAEARLLASEGKLTDDVEASVAAAVKEHSDKAKENIAKMRETDEDEAALAEIAFASALAVQTEALEGQAAKEMPETEGQDGSSVATLAMMVAQESQVADATQAEAKPSYEKLLARVEVETTRAYELFASVSEVASPEEVTDIERRLGDIERKINEAILFHDGSVVENVMDENEELPAEEAEVTEATEETEETEVVEIEDKASSTEDTLSGEVSESVVSEEAAGAALTEEVVVVDPEAAVTLLRAALTDTRKLISFMTNIDVRENINLDELVPLTLTADEKIILIKNTLNEVNKVQLEIDARIVPEDTYEKFTHGQEKLTTLMLTAKAEMAADNLDSAYALADEALLVVADLFAMTSAAVQLEEVEMKASSTEEQSPELE